MAQYAGIVEIIAPAIAVQGSRVDVQVVIKNLHISTIGVMAGGALEYGVTPLPVITFPGYWANVPAGQSVSFDGYFIMPEADVKLHAYSYWYGADGGWYFEDEQVKEIKLNEPVSAFSEFEISDYRTV